MLVGSSLLTRGKLLFDHLRRKNRRIIPAYAGKTPPQSFCSSVIPDHPCLRGENASFVYLVISNSGSSLLTRGKLTSGWIFQIGRRIIPAYAGKTRFDAFHRPATPDHPCLRGENLTRKLSVQNVPGSSLLTRGKPKSSDSSMKRLRIIPAYAGKTNRHHPEQ